MSTASDHNGDRRQVLKRLAAIGAGAAAASVVAGRSMIAPVTGQAVEAVSASVLPTPPIYSGWDFIVLSDGAVWQAYNAKTGQPAGSSGDLATVLNALITGDNIGIFVEDGLPFSTGTVTINRNGITLFCPKRNGKDYESPSIRKIIIGGSTTQDVQNIWLHGFQMDELEISAPDSSGTYDVDGVTVESCQAKNEGAPGRRGLRFTGPGDIENITFISFNVRARAHGCSLISFEGSSWANGHMVFLNGQFDNVSGFQNVDFISTSNTGINPVRTNFIGCSFVNIGPDPPEPQPIGCHIVHIKTSQVNPGELKGLAAHFSGCHFEIQKAEMDLILVDANPSQGYTWCDLAFRDPLVTVGPFTYNWIVNNNSLGNFFAGSGVQITGGRLFADGTFVFNPGTLQQGTNFKVLIADVNRFNPQGVASITVGPSPFTHTNHDGVREVVFLDGARGGSPGTLTVKKDTVTLYSIGANEKFHLAVLLEPMEALTVTYLLGDSVTMKRDRK